MNFSSQRVGTTAGLLTGALLVAGCASPGPPRPPSLHLPQRLTHIQADRQGGAVVVRYTVPLRSSDNVLLTAPVFATLCRAVGDGPCIPTASFPGKVQVAGPVEWSDVLPRDLASGPDRLLTYRVELFNPKGRSAGPSEPAYAAAGSAPAPVQGLKAEGSHRGILLRWQAESQPSGQVLVERDDLATPPPQPAKAVADKKPVLHRGKVPAKPLAPTKWKEDAPVQWLQSERADADTGGMVDGAAHAGEPYRYIALRRRKTLVGGQHLELRSEASASVTLRMEDIYPPTVPHGVQAVSFAPEGGNFAADLVWEPDAESDLAGYNVYRETLAADGTYSARRRLNAQPVALPAFHDATIARGLGYRYTVTAVDLKGNESAASEAAVLEATP